MGASSRTPAAVSASLGISPATMYRRLNGYGAPFTVDQLDALARAFDVPITTFFDPPEWLLRLAAEGDPTSPCMSDYDAQSPLANAA